MSSWLHSSDHRLSWRKRSWAARALSSSSCSLPPLGLLAFFAIVVFFLAVSGYVDYKAIERRAEIGARVFAVPLALAAAFLLFAALSWRRRYWTTRRTRQRAAANHYPWSSSSSSSHQAPSAAAAPWGVAVAVAILLLMMTFQESVHSMWFRPLWDSDYYDP